MFALSSNSTQLNPNQLKLIVFVLRVRVVAEALARAYRRAPMSRRMVHSGDQLYIIHLAVASARSEIHFSRERLSKKWSPGIEDGSS